MVQSERLKAIVLRRTNYAEADRILQLITPKGRRSVIAKGVRRERSKLAGGIELLAVCDVVVNQGRGELGLLTSARLVEFYQHILEDYERMQFAYQAMKLVASASEMVDEPEWFVVLHQVLANLNNLDTPQQLVETWFYLQYTKLLGEELNLQIDVASRPLEPSKTYMYDVGEKSLRPSEQGEIGSDHIKFLRLVQAKQLAVVSQIGGVDEILADCWLLARQHAAL